MSREAFYPLRVGKFTSVIVTDDFATSRGPMPAGIPKADLDYEWDQNGGFIFAESIPPGMAQKLVDAYNEKYAPKEQEADDGPSVVDFESDIDSQIGVMDDLMIKASDKSSYQAYRAIKETLMSVKRWNESPAYHGKVDVEKVIENLVDICKDAMNKHGNSDIRAVPEGWTNCIQNAEAALGMLQAFKQERTKWSEFPPMMEKKLQHQGHYKFIPQEERDQLIDELRQIMKDGNFANAIIFAIESMDDLKRKYGKQ